MMSRSYLTGISAAELPDKYERDRKCVTYTFAKLKFLVTEELPNWASVPHPCVLCIMAWHRVGADRQLKPQC